MSKKIARITQDKKLLLANEVVEDSTKIKLNSDGRLDTDEIIEYPAELEGGRNLLTGASKEFKKINIDNWFGVMPNSRFDMGGVLNVGDTVTFRAYIKAPQGRESAVRITEYYSDGSSYRAYLGNLVSDGYSTLTYTIGEINPNVSHIVLNFQNDKPGENSTYDIEYKEEKFEKGNIVTPWTPAPEDLGLNYPDSIQNFNSSISGNNIIVPEFIEGYPFVKPVIDDSLVLWLDGSTGNNYEQTGTWKDLSGNGNDGQLVNFGYIEGSGWVDGGLKFDGVDDYVECQNIFNVDYDSTYEVVVNLKRDTGTYMDILVRRHHWGDSIFVSGSQLRFYLVLDDGSEIYLNINNIIKYDGEILHITRVFKDGDFYIYIDGELKSKTEKGLKGIPANDIRNSPYQISHPAYPIDGDIKLVRIYNRALTDEEILQNYRAGQCSPLLAMRGDV